MSIGLRRFEAIEQAGGTRVVIFYMRAQLSWLEHMPYKHGVDGSSPLVRTIAKNNYFTFQMFTFTTLLYYAWYAIVFVVWCIININKAKQKHKL